MARPKRMGAYNALDDLLPGVVGGNREGPPSGSGPAWDLSAAEPASPPARRPRLEPVPDPLRPPGRRSRDRRPGPNALDELLPGPPSGGMGDPLGAPSSAPPSRRLGATPRPRSAGRHLEVWNPLDGPPPASPAPDPPPPPPAKVRVSFRLPADLVETARDTVAHLAGTTDQTTLTALTERALRVELARLAITHNHGRPFPRRIP
jgi:hypothetical protein